MATVASPKGLFLFCSGVGTIYAAATSWSRRKRKIEMVPVEEQVDFMPMRSASPIAVQIDPRADSGQDPL